MSSEAQSGQDIGDGEGAETPVRPAVRYCACGCGEPVLSRRTYAGRLGIYLRGHNRRVAKTAAQRKAAAQTFALYNQRSCVDPAPVQKILAQRFASAAECARALGVDERTVRRWMQRRRMRRTTAEWILRAVAGLPRPPSFLERRLTAERMRLVELERLAEKRRLSREEQREAIR